MVKYLSLAFVLAATTALAQPGNPSVIGGNNSPGTPVIGVAVDALGNLIVSFANGGKQVIPNIRGGGGAVGGVASLNGRGGAVSLTPGDITGAIGFTPYSATNPAGYQTSAQVATALPGLASASTPGLVQPDGVTTSIVNGKLTIPTTTPGAPPSGFSLVSTDTVLVIRGSGAGAATYAVPASMLPGGSSLPAPAPAPAVATGYTMALSAPSGAPGSPVTATFTPTGGAWPSSEVLTLAASGVAGTYSPATLSPTGSGAVTATWTPSATGTASLSATSSPALTDAAAVSYTVAASSALTNAYSVTWDGPTPTGNTVITAPYNGYWDGGPSSTYYFWLDATSGGTRYMGTSPTVLTAWITSATVPPSAAVALSGYGPDENPDGYVAATTRGSGEWSNNARVSHKADTATATGGPYYFWVSIDNGSTWSIARTGGQPVSVTVTFQ